MKQANPLEAAEQPPEPTTEAESFGTWLRRQREGRQIALREIADQSKISMRYLQALEADRFDVLPAAVFAKGFLRQYAGYVGLDPEEVVNFYLSARQAQEEEDEENAPVTPHATPSSSASGRTILWVTLALLGIVALVYFFEQRGRGADPAVSAPPPAVLPPSTAPPPAPLPAAGAEESPPAPPETVAAAPLVVVLDFTGECWVQARVDGVSALSKTYVEGESEQLDGEEWVELTFGDGDAVRVEVNGHPFSLDSTPGQVVRGLRIDLETARRLAEENE